MKKRKLRADRWLPLVGRTARFLFRSRLLSAFLALCVLGIAVGASTRPRAGALPYDELFENLGVVSYRDSPSDTAARFLVELSAGGRVFAEYDVDGRRFLPPSRGRGYTRTITGTRYGPMHVRGHVAQGLWLEMPRSSGRSLLPEQFDELYRTTLGFVKPVSLITGALGMLSGYSIGYRLATWNASLSSRAVQERVLATPGLGRTIAREAWRRVLLEPEVMDGEDGGARFAAVHGTQRLYANFFRLALNDSDGFIPREAARLASLGRADASRAMLAFAEAARRAATDSVQLGSGDFDAVERWASLLDRRGHWAQDAIPPAGEERARYLGTLAWYGLEPPSPDAERVWIGSRMLVRIGEAEGFVADEIPATGVGCPLSWRARLNDASSSTSAFAHAWFADRPEFSALATLGGRVAAATIGAGRRLAAVASRPAPPRESLAPRAPAQRAAASRTAVAAYTDTLTLAVPPASGAAPRRSFAFPIRALGGCGSVTVIAADSAAAAADARAALSAIARLDSLAGDSTAAAGDARAGSRGRALDAAAAALRALGVRDALVALAGDALAFGSPGDAEGWRVAIPDPRDPAQPLAWLRLSSGEAVASAGPSAPCAATSPPADPPAAGLLSVAVLAPDATSAEAWSVTLFALAPAAATHRAGERADLPSLLVEPGADGTDTVWVASALRGRIELDGGRRARVRVSYF